MTGGADAPTAVLKGSIPAWANSKNLMGTADPGGDVGFRVYLGWNNNSAVQALASAVSDPSSSSYRKFLTPAQFRQEFAPSQAQVGAVQSWLKSQGFSVEYTPQNNHYVSAEGTVAQAEAAFGATFGEYSVGGLTVRSPESDVTIPDSLSGMVSGVVGLDDSAQFVVTDHTPGATNAPPPAAFVNAPPCSTYWGQAQATGYPNPYGKGTLPYAPCGYTPAQVKGAYGLSGTSYTGACHLPGRPFASGQAPDYRLAGRCRAAGVPRPRPRPGYELDPTARCDHRTRAAAPHRQGRPHDRLTQPRTWRAAHGSPLDLR
jgi:subtilase family serine protease